jgi:hypothetical protein
MDKQYEKVTEVLNDGKPIKTGQYMDKKTNQTKTWEKYKVLTDSGSQYYPFGPVEVGDTLELWEDDKWDGIQAKVVRKDKFATIIDKLDEILKLLRNEPTGRDKALETAKAIKERVDAKNEFKGTQKAPQVDEWGNTDEYMDEPINLSDIPF